MPLKLLAVLAKHLPRIAEEGSDVEALAETELVGRLVAEGGTDPIEAATALALARRLFQSLSLLDDRRLAEGVWAFSSFPASLLARSLIGGLSLDEFRLLEPGFWDSSDYRVDRQRALIKRSEEFRAATTGGLVPIRRVWVSWAWVALDGRFLMVRREDPAAHRDGSHGQFVFPGGRLTTQDLPNLLLSARLDFLDPTKEVDPLIATGAYEAALRREVQEELDIHPSDLEATFPTKDSIRYTALEGAKSAFSATEYRIQPFQIALTASGRLSLLHCLAANVDRFRWFTADELAAGTNSDGATAFVDAINSESVGRASLDAASCEIYLGDRKPLKEPIEIPGAVAEPLSLGISGRERAVHVELDRVEIALLGWFAAVRRNDSITQLAPGVSVVPSTGWVLIEDERLLSGVKALASKLDSQSLHFLSFEGCAVRLNSAVPTDIYFSPRTLAFEISDERRGKSFRLTLFRRAIECAIGTAPEMKTSTTLPEILGGAVYALAQGDPGFAFANIDTVKRMQRDVRGHLDRIGARLLIRQVDGVPQLAIGEHHLN